MYQDSFDFSDEEAGGGCFFFDTETTGLPRRWDAPLEDVENWPRMVQLAWMLCDARGNELEQGSCIIRPEGYKIPYGVAKIHGITTARAQEEGRPLPEVLEQVQPLIIGAAEIAAHNIAFDEKILGAEFLRLGLVNPLDGKRRRCTMREAQRWCRLPAKYGHDYKPPNLTELHTKLFGRGFAGAHDALADVRACKACFYELRRRGVLK